MAYEVKSDPLIKSFEVLIGGKPFEANSLEFKYEHLWGEKPLAYINEVDVSDQELTFSARLTRGGRKFYREMMNTGKSYRLYNRRGRNRLVFV